MFVMTSTIFINSLNYMHHDDSPALYRIMKTDGYHDKTVERVSSI